MAEKKKEETEQAVRLATEAQWKLCEQLYEETGYARKYTRDDFMQLEREQASQHIAYLKECKVRDQQLRSQNQRVPQFDKIAFGLCYKLVYNNWDAVGSYAAVNNKTFMDMVVEEYFKFKDTQQHCREQVAEGGQQ